MSDIMYDLPFYVKLSIAGLILLITGVILTTLKDWFD